MKRPRPGCALLLGLLLPLAAARGQHPFPDQNSVSSVSGQFVVSCLNDGAPPVKTPAFAANTNIVRLTTPLLAVASERFKISLWQQLGIPPNSSWSGKIFLQVHPALSLDETVVIKCSPFLDHWNYEVELPDAIAKNRYARALSGVLLLELANRSAPPGGHSAELPDWLVAGCAQQLLAADGDKIVLSAPVKKLDELRVNRINQTERGLDSLANARQVLQNLPVLTFDQLSWPTDAQLNGTDGGAYYASAQLFVSELLALKNGKEDLRAMLADLPGHLNWQTAFFQAFGRNFQRPLEVEKWWALRVVNFAARAPGPRWTTDVSLARMEQLLSVPVEFRGDSNAFPTHAEISLQAALKNLGPAQRDAIIRTKARDLALVELRLAAPFGDLADGYRVTLANFLGEIRTPVQATATNKHGVPMARASVSETLKKLEALDRRRREAEAKAVSELSRGSKAAPQPAVPPARY